MCIRDSLRIYIIYSIKFLYDHNLYQIVLLDKENILYPPAEKLTEEKEEIISRIAEESSYSNQDNPNKIVTDNKKSLLFLLYFIVRRTIPLTYLKIYNLKCEFVK